MNKPADRLLQGLMALAIALPWLNPFASGPSPAVTQTLLTWGCVALLLMLGVLSGGLGGTRADWVAASAWAWLAAALISSVAALLQYFGFSEHFSPWVNSTSAGEAFANLRQRNQFATLVNIGAAALLWRVVRAPAQAADQAAAPLAAGPAGLASTAAAALLGVANAASSSRTGLMQLVMLVLLAGLWGGWRRAGTRRLLLALVLGYGVATLLLPLLAGLSLGSTGILARLKDQAPACTSRLTLWSNVLHLIALKPLGGWGWGELDYAHFINLYPGARFCDILDNAHNLPLHLAVELGLPTALLLCGGGLWLAWRGRPWRELDAGRQMAWAVLAVILLHSMLEYPLWYGPFQVAFGLCVLLLWPRKGALPAGDGQSAPGPRTAGVAGLGVALLLVLGVGYAAWDYHRISQIYLPPEERDEAYRDDTLGKIQASWLFHDQVEFAELTTTPLSPDNAARIQRMAQHMLHFSPEARVVEKLVESAMLQGQRDVAAFYLMRLQAAFPADHARWLQAHPEAASAARGP